MVYSYSVNRWILIFYHSRGTCPRPDRGTGI